VGWGLERERERERTDAITELMAISFLRCVSLFQDDVIL